jgi:hypothetical protein
LKVALALMDRVLLAIEKIAKLTGGRSALANG